MAIADKFITYLIQILSAILANVAVQCAVGVVDRGVLSVFPEIARIHEADVKVELLD